MTLIQWRASKGLCRWAEQTFNSEEGQSFLQMLEQVHVKNFQPANPNAELELGKIYGYDLALNNIAAACQFQEPVKPLGPAKFEESKD